MSSTSSSSSSSLRNADQNDDENNFMQSSTTSSNSRQDDSDNDEGVIAYSISASSKCVNETFLAQDSQRTKLVKELFSSEQTYVKALETLVKVFIEPLEIKSIIPKELSLLFQNVQLILGLNRTFLDKIRERMSEWTESSNIGDILVYFAPFMKMYKTYVQQHEYVSKYFKNLRSRNIGTTFLRTIDSLMMNPLCNNSPLESFLILPVQRIPRYKMLFDGVVKHTPNDHTDKKNILSAAKQSAHVALQINDALRCAEERAKLLDLQRRFVNDVDIVTPSRRLKRHSKLIKVCRAKNQEYDFFLFNDMLMYAKQVSTMNNFLKLHRALPIDSVFDVLDIPSHKEGEFSFQIRSREKSFEVRAKSHEDKVEWLLVIMEAITNQRRRREIRTQSIEESQSSASPIVSDVLAPIWTPDSHSVHCTICKAKFSVLKRRHHCRYCGSLVCNECSPHRVVKEGTFDRVRVCRTCHIITPNKIEVSKKNCAQIIDANKNNEGHNVDDDDNDDDGNDNDDDDDGNDDVDDDDDDGNDDVDDDDGNDDDDDDGNDDDDDGNDDDGNDDDDDDDDDDDALNTMGDLNLKETNDSRQHDAGYVIEREIQTPIPGEKSSASLDNNGDSVSEITNDSYSSSQSLFWRALVDSNSNCQNELSYCMGDIICVNLRYNSQWWMGVNARTQQLGWFGPAFTSPIASCSNTAQQHGLPVVALSSFDGIKHPSLPLAKKKKFRAENNRHTSRSDVCYSDEKTLALKKNANFSTLSFLAGQTVFVTSAIDQDWWFGRTLSGQEGYFPSSLVNSASST